MTTEPLQHLGGFLGGAAAFVTALWGITLFVANWFSKRRTKAIVEATTAYMQEFVKTKMLECIKDMDPESFYTLDLHFQNGLSIAAPMILDKPLFVSENIQIKAVSHTAEETMLLLTCKGFGHFIPHYHEHTCETIEVREGSITCMETGVVYRKGDLWKIPAGEMHSATFQDCVAIITHRPPLPTAKQRPVDLENVQHIFPK